MDATPEQLQEYESQLENVKQLLEASPEDESLQSLRTDLEELVALTRSTLEGASVDVNDGNSGGATATEEAATSTDARTAEGQSEAAVSSVPAIDNIDTALIGDEEIQLPSHQQESEAVKKTSKKRKKASSEEAVKDVFEIPSHLIVLDTDTDAERNKKRRTAKALKNKWRIKRKEMESNSRQASWQSFQKKNSKNSKRKGAGGGGGQGGSTIFSTQEGSLNDRVGVISKKQMTSYDSRKRHKY